MRAIARIGIFYLLIFYSFSVTFMVAVSFHSSYIDILLSIFLICTISDIAIGQFRTLQYAYFGHCSLYQRLPIVIKPILFDGSTAVFIRHLPRFYKAVTL